MSPYLLRTFLLISALSVSGCAEKPSWKLFEKNDGTAVYYLQNKADSGKHSVSIRYAFASPQVFTKPDGSQVQFHVREETLLLKCDDGTFSTPDFSLHQPTEKGNAGVVYWQSVAPDKTEWIPIGDGSLVKKLMDSSIIAC